MTHYKKVHGINQLGWRNTSKQVMLSQPVPSLSVSGARQASHNCTRRNKDTALLRRSGTSHCIISSRDEDLGGGGGECGARPPFSKPMALRAQYLTTWSWYTCSFQNYIKIPADTEAISPICCESHILCSGMVGSHHDFFESCRKWVWSRVCACATSPDVYFALPP